ncbi:MAG TPA: response regulator transcription factor [Bacteroidia bacterium]|nr:response regulator transcription factor [Bacteroidia bacterium]
MRILIADDHELVRGGVAKIIAEEFTEAEIIQASGGIEAEKKARAEKLDLIIMDMSMPDKTGLDVLKQLRAEAIKTPVLILSIHPENQYSLRVLKAGGNGYLSKDCPHADFIYAVKTVLNGKKYVSIDMVEQLATRFDGNIEKEQHELISDRELQVLKLIASGKTVSEIAAKLLLSVPTISTYRSRLLDKMNLKNNAELTLYAINNGLV